MGRNQHVRRFLSPAPAAIGRQRPCRGTEASAPIWAASASAGPSASSSGQITIQQQSSPHLNLLHTPFCLGGPLRGFYCGFVPAISCRQTTQPQTFAAAAGGRRLPWTPAHRAVDRGLATGQDPRPTDAAGVPPAHHGAPKGHEGDAASVISSSAEDAQIWTAAATRPAALPPLSPQSLFKTLGLEEMTDEELRDAFGRIDKNGDGVLSPEEVEELLREHVLNGTGGMEQGKLEELVRRIMQGLDSNSDGMVTRQEFTENIRKMAGTVDGRVYHLAACMGVAGVSMGLTIPLMPQLVAELGLTVQDFGMATSAFGAFKMLSNFPAAYATDKFGRVPVLAGGLAGMALSFAALISSSTAATLAAARGLNGAGASCFLTAATSYVVDISNPLNRARSMAPLLTAFSAGAALGPVIGGFLASMVSMHTTFGLMGGLYATMALYCSRFVPETLERSRSTAVEEDAAGKAGAVVAKGLSWSSLLRKPEILDTVCLNIIYSGIQAGAQMTLLPLMLTQSLGMDTAAVGAVFAGMAVVNVLGAQLVANAADRFGPQVMMGPSSLAVGCALMALPMVHDVPSALAPAVLLWAAGNTVMGSNPVTHVATVAPPSQKAQAGALLRTTGDMGFLLGGIGSGVLASLSSIDTVLGGSGAVFCGAAAAYIARGYFRRNRPPGGQ